ncbi:MAG TPA: glycosyltransferase family 1 protein [Terriglobales bacterium]|nr:glycosyltransferase family 1 protein [Terriglobales bacterium]
MKIAYDLRRIKNPGIGRYMKCLVEAVLARAPEHEYLLIVPPEGVEIDRQSNAQVEVVCCSLKYYSVREQIELPWILRRHRIDLFHSPHFNLPLASSCPMIATLHDVIFLACPEDLPSRLGRTYYRGMMEATVRRAKRIITVSEFSKRDIHRCLHAESAEIDVVHSGVDPYFTRVDDPIAIQEVLGRFGIRGDYVFYTGIYKPRKNHAVLMRSFARLLAKGANAQLVLGGPLEEGKKELRALATDLGIGERVLFTGLVSDGELRVLYSAGRVYACPSLYEGFGFTVLEAMACGTPVVSSSETSLPEVAGSAALYADARNTEEFGAALYQSFTDSNLRERLIKAGKANVKRFCWTRAAEQTLQVYERVMPAPSTGAAHA